MASEAPRIDPRASGMPPLPFAEALNVRIEIRDPEVIAEIRRQPEGVARDEYLKVALRIGVLSLRMASGSLDMEGIQNESRNLVTRLRDLLEERQQQITNSLEHIFSEYLDPAKGKLDTRLAALTRQGGELDSLLRTHVDGDSSALARTLAAHVGEQSKLFRMLSPEEAGGLRAQVQGVLEQALEDQRQKLLDQFSLDKPDSALKRLADTIERENRRLGKEFSLDEPNSALTRLSQTLDSTKRAIQERLTLDDPSSPLATLSRALAERIEEIRQKNEQFQSEVKQTLEALQARRRTEQITPRQGLDFESQLATALAPLASGYGDLLEDCRATTGLTPRSKVGDFVTRMSAESAAPGAGIVWEAKSSEAYSLKQALGELEEARKNRDAQVGIFVWERSRAKAEQKPLQRFGNDLVILWDTEDPSTDILLEAAYTVARALAVRMAQATEDSVVSAGEVEAIANAVEQKLEKFQDIRTKTQTIVNNANTVLSLAGSLEELLREQMARLHGLSARMRV